jgi:hypothetical protein
MAPILALIAGTAALVSFGFCVVSIRRLYSYIQAHRFEESQYTLLLGVIHLRWIVGLYLIVTLSMSLMLAIFFIPSFL